MLMAANTASSHKLASPQRIGSRATIIVPDDPCQDSEPDKNDTDDREKRRE